MERGEAHPPVVGAHLRSARLPFPLCHWRVLPALAVIYEWQRGF